MKVNYQITLKLIAVISSFFLHLRYLYYFCACVKGKGEGAEGDYCNIYGIL